MEDLNQLYRERVDLGPMWNEMELEVFLKTFRMHGIQSLPKMQSTLRELGYFRSQGQLLSVYRKNKNFLESNLQCTAHDLYLILRDHYEQDDFIQQSRVRKSEASQFPASGINQETMQRVAAKACDDSNKGFYTWVKHETFYSHLDSTYFDLNEFQQMLSRVDMDFDHNIQQWRVIRSAMGKPRRFSPYFIHQERQKLDKFRHIVRNYLDDQQYPIHREIKNHELIQKIVRLAPFSVGAPVIAVHPQCQHIHTGSIISTNLPHILVRFDHEDLGVHKILDQQVQLQDMFLSSQQTNDRFDIQQQLQNCQNEASNSQLQSIVQDLDFWAASFLTRILQRKYALIQNLQLLNQKVEQNPKLAQDHELRELYSWTIVTIKQFDSAQMHAVTKFRLRGLNSFKNDSPEIINHLDRVLQMPLAYMERELENNEDDTKKELRSIIYKRQDDKIHQQVLSILNNHFTCHEVDASYYQLIQALIGIIHTVNQVGDINSETSQYMAFLAKQIEATHPEAYDEINELIMNIVTSQNK